MARTKKDAKIDTPAARNKLKQRPEPYWAHLGPGKHLGCRVGSNGRTWIARLYSSAADKPKVFQALGAADDANVAANGSDVLDWEQAKSAAAKWFSEKTGSPQSQKASEFSVSHCITEYFAEQRRLNKRGADRAECAAKAHILPLFGDKLVAEISSEEIEAWLGKLATSGRRRRTKKGVKTPVISDPPKTEEDKRKRRDSANRIWSILRAALNLAANRKREGCNSSRWAGVRDFPSTGSPRGAHFKSHQITAFLAVCPPDFQRLAIGAIHTGARYGELRQVRIETLDLDNKTLYLPPEITKTKVGRHVNLLGEAVDFFRSITAGRAKRELIFKRDGVIRRKRATNEDEWLPSDQKRFMDQACEDAGVAPCTFHGLRHTAVSHWLNNGATLGDVAEQIGDSEATTRKHYAHLCKDARGERLERKFVSLEINGIYLNGNSIGQKVASIESIEDMLTLG